jgi:hypothetical protein
LKKESHLKILLQSEQGWLVTARPTTLAAVIGKSDMSQLRQLPQLDLSPLKTHILVTNMPQTFIAIFASVDADSSNVHPPQPALPPSVACDCSRMCGKP